MSTTEKTPAAAKRKEVIIGLTIIITFSIGWIIFEDNLNGYIIGKTTCEELEDKVSSKDFNPISKYIYAEVLECHPEVSFKDPSQKQSEVSSD